MCNCGNKRSLISAAPDTVNRHQTQQQRKMWPEIPFSYIGNTSLTVKGTFTGRQYRFSAPGDRQMIDFRDAPSMMNVPVLKRS